jgi:hypothetical protein
MIAAAGCAAYARGKRSTLDLAPDPSWCVWKTKTVDSAHTP